MKESGREGRWKGEEPLHGLMETDMKGTGELVRGKGEEPRSTLIEVSMKANGKLVGQTVRGPTQP